MEDKHIDKEGLLPIGTALSNKKYKIEGYLSSGGFGNTYVATDTAFDEKVAIKELYIRGVCGRDANTTDISISLTENQRTFVAQREKFKKEAKRLRKLTNPHIIRVHDLFDENGTSYYVMDFVDGESLSERMKRTGKPLTEQELMRILPQVLDALEAVHAEGIWHLDLKPANIMLDKNGNALLIDFGASKQLRNKDGESLSTSSALAYTPGFASSEQMEQNIEKFGPWTDLYALGATLYNLLTMNQPPSPSDIDEDAEKALTLPNYITKKMSNLIFWLMKPNRRMRPQNVEDVKQFLAEVPEIKPVQTTTTTKSRKIPIREPEEETRLKSDNRASQGQNANPNGKVTKGKVMDIWGCFFIIIAIAVSIGIGTAFKGSNKSIPLAESIDVSQNEVVEPTTERTNNETISVKNEWIVVEKGPENMRSYSYTGEVDEYHIPQGQGTAVYDKYGNIPAATYEGYFKNGLCSGSGTLSFATGDKFTGIFAEGYYQSGTYTLADGSYFEGSFQSSQPWNGTWYNKCGWKDAEVRNGVEDEHPGER